MVRFRHYEGFTGLNTSAKLAHAQQLIEMYTGRLRTGWTPFADASQAIYNDHIDYKTVATLYGSRRAGNRSVRLLISRFIDSLQDSVRGTTIITYTSKLRIFALWIEKKGAGGNDISTIDNKLISLFFRYLIDDRKLSRVSIRKYTELLTNFFDFLLRQKVIIQNPVFDLPDCKRINDHAPRPIMRADIETFKKEIQKDPELWLAIQLEFYCGMRPGHEIRRMKIKDIDFVAGTIRVTRDRAKNHHERIVTIPNQLLQQLRNFYRLHIYNKEWYVFGRGGHPAPDHIGKNKLNYKFTSIRKRLNMPLEYKLYSWKHTGAIEADENNIPLKDISTHLGHTDLKTTSIYFRNKKPGVSKAIRDNFPDL
jgi:integrase